MYPHQVFVLHSAYPDGTWRGLEKCSGTPEDCVRVFAERAPADEALAKMREDVRPYFQVVEVTLVTPDVRAPLDQAAWAKVNEVLP
jgi:hypothetical protein